LWRHHPDRAFREASLNGEVSSNDLITADQYSKLETKLKGIIQVRLHSDLCRLISLDDPMDETLSFDVGSAVWLGLFNLRIGISSGAKNSVTTRDRQPVFTIGEVLDWNGSDWVRIVDCSNADQRVLPPSSAYEEAVWEMKGLIREAIDSIGSTKTAHDTFGSQQAIDAYLDTIERQMLLSREAIIRYVGCTKDEEETDGIVYTFENSSIELDSALGNDAFLAGKNIPVTWSVLASKFSGGVEETAREVTLIIEPSRIHWQVEDV